MTAQTAGAAAPRKAKAPAAEAAAGWPSAGVAYYTAFVLILSTTFAQLDIAIVPYLAINIKRDLHINDFEYSLLVGASFGLFYTLVGLPIAWFLDRFSRKWLLGVAIAVWSLGTALCGVAQNYAQLFLSRFLVGAGEAVNGPAAYSIVADLFPRERMTRGVTILQIGSWAGPALGLLISFFLLKAFLDMPPIRFALGVIHGWQLIFVLIGLPGLLVSLLMLTTMPEPARHTIPNQVSGLADRPTNVAAGVLAWFSDFGQAFAYIFKHWQVFVPMFGSLFVGSLGAGAAAFMAIFYKTTFGWGPAQLAGLNFIPSLILMPIGMVIGLVLSERLLKRGRADAALLTYLISAVVGLPSVFAVMAPNPWLAWGLASLTFFGIGIGGPSQNAAFQIVTPTELRGKMTALYLFFYSVVGIAFSPIITGWISDFVLHDESKIRWAIFIPAILSRPTALLISWLGLKPYEREVRRLKALEGQPS